MGDAHAAAVSVCNSVKAFLAPPNISASDGHRHILQLSLKIIRIAYGLFPRLVARLAAVGIQPHRDRGTKMPREKQFVSSRLDDRTQHPQNRPAEGSEHVGNGAISRERYYTASYGCMVMPNL